MTPEEHMRLMDKLEPLCDELKPYVFDYGPFRGINHPLVQEIPFYGDTRCALLNQRLRMKQEMVAEAVTLQNWPKYIMLHERPYRLDALRVVTCLTELAEQQLAPLLADVWVDSENVWQHQRVWLEMWRKLEHPHLTMDEHEQTFLKHLKVELMTVYRGIRGPRQNPGGMSWTLDKEKALYFAKRYNAPAPLLLTGRVERSRVFAYFAGRNESEIVVDPAYVKVTSRQAL